MVGGTVAVVGLLCTAFATAYWITIYPSIEVARDAQRYERSTLVYIQSGEPQWACIVDTTRDWASEDAVVHRLAGGDGSQVLRVGRRSAAFPVIVVSVEGGALHIGVFDGYSLRGDQRRDYDDLVTQFVQRLIARDCGIQEPLRVTCSGGWRPSVCGRDQG